MLGSLKEEFFCNCYLIGQLLIWLNVNARYLLVEITNSSYDDAKGYNYEAVDYTGK